MIHRAHAQHNIKAVFIEPRQVKYIADRYISQFVRARFGADNIYIVLNKVSSRNDMPFVREIKRVSTRTSTALFVHIAYSHSTP
jgi:hypothetical protein